MPNDPPDPEPSELGGVNPDELFARGLRSVRMTGSGGAHGWEPPSLGEAAQLFPNYEVLALLGCGGMGAVYQARQLALDRVVAIKLLPLEVSVDRDFADRFVREARTMGKLNHPNIIAVYDFGKTSEGHLYFAMEFVEGSNLHETIHGPGLDPAQALTILVEVCDALAYAHGKGVVHRDIKPANVMVNTEGHVKVADFGLARLTDPAAEQVGKTLTGTVMGTPAYMAPEQTRGMNVDHRADIYSLGVMLYEMLCRETPQGVFDAPSTRAAVDARVDQVVATAMAQQPERRFQSSTEMRVAVEQIRTTPMMRATPRATAAPPPVKPRTALYLGLASVLVVVLSVVFWPKPKPVRKSRLAPPKSAEASPAPATPVPVLASATPVPVPVVVAPPPPAATPAPVVEPKMPEPPVVVAPPPEVPPPAPKASAEVIQWLAQVEAQHTAQYQGEATGPFEKATATLRAQYLAQVERGSEAATKAGKLDDTLAWRNEQARLSAGQQPHDAPDEPTEPAALRQLRENWRKAFAKLDVERFTKAKAVHQRFDSLLDRGQTGYTQKARLDDALLLKAKREAIRAAWLTPAVDFSKPGAPKPAAATPKPFGTAMQSPRQAEGLLSGREAFELFVQLNADLHYLDSEGLDRVFMHDAKAGEIPRGKLDPQSVDLRYKKRDDTELTDQDFKQLGPLRKLTYFALDARQITGTGLAFLSGSPDLASVTLQGLALTDAVLEPLVGLRKLENLRLSGFEKPLAWTRLGELSALPNLTTFYTEHAESIPPAVLARARKLRSLHLGESRLTEEHFAAIGTLSDLDNFYLGGQGEAGAAGLRHLEKCTKLGDLNLVGSFGLGPHLGFIGKLRKLTTLYLDGADAPGLAAAAGAPALRTINLAGYAGSLGTTDEGLKAIAAGFPRLEALVFMDAAARTVSAEGIRALAKLPKLKSFNWGKGPLSVELATELAAFPALEQLLAPSCGINESQLTELAKSKSLTKLDIAFDKISPAAIEVLKTMRGLRELNVYSTGINLDDLAALRKALPKCKVSN